MTGTPSRTARAATVRWGLKEAEGKTLARRTGIVYEAVVLGEESIVSEAQYLYGKHGRRCGGHKCEGHASYPGRSVILPCASCIERCSDGLAEVSRRHISWPDQSVKD